ncbi:hypothetical protein chiPu_0033089, partial [Chiloscyllium punctatum]|nr:hypothetical protein [Chiloscyllium punctatum]
AADEDAALPADQHELDLAARLLAADLDRIREGKPARRAAVIDRRRRGPGDAERLELGDVLVARHRITAGPAGDHGLPDFQRERCCHALIVDIEGEIKHG